MRSLPEQRRAAPRPAPSSLAAALGLCLLAACASDGKLRSAAAGVRASLEESRRLGAGRCAPKELAAAQVQLDSGLSALEQGHRGRAGEHLGQAEQGARTVLELTRACPPPPPPTPAPRKVIVIERVDTDGDGVPDVEDRCPTVPGLPEYQGCPAPRDSDGDGIPDDIDRCPLDPEDLDGFQDDDGCPDPDNDGDGIVDKLDACPNTPGPLENRGCPVLDRDGDGVPDPEDRCPDEPGPRENGGCPDVDTDRDGLPDRLDRCPTLPGPGPDGCPRKFTLVEVQPGRIAIRQPVRFGPAQWKVLPESFALLDQVAQALLDVPALRLSVEGHTDSVGGEEMNVKLSQARADSVKAVLVRKGIAEERIEAVGFGSRNPVASNQAEAGRAQNRRIEFRLLAE